MRTFLILSSLTFLLVACKSVPEEVKEDKRKFIQVAQENSKPVEFSDLSNLLEQARENDTERKIKSLGIDKMETVYESTGSSKINLDSVVVFTKSNYIILYDFATIDRNAEIVREKSNLNDFEKLDDRLYIGKK